MALNEWLNLMLDEVRRKRDERKRAAEEHTRRREGAAVDRNRAGEDAARGARAGRSD
jgi:hypothetical protein